MRELEREMTLCKKDAATASISSMSLKQPASQQLWLMKNCRQSQMDGKQFLPKKIFSPPIFQLRPKSKLL